MSQIMLTTDEWAIFCEQVFDKDPCLIKFIPDKCETLDICQKEVYKNGHSLQMNLNKES